MNINRWVPFPASVLFLGSATLFSQSAIVHGVPLGLPYAMNTIPPVVHQVNPDVVHPDIARAVERRGADPSEVAKQTAGEAFLAANAQKQGVVSTESGLQYEVLQEGTGSVPAATDTVQVHYRGTLLDGSEFDSSYARGVPAEFAVTQVIQGWQEALQMMPQGSKWRVFIPPHLAYGEQGAGDQIGPDATLIFDIELIEVK